MKTLILTEKPSVARDFAQALGVQPKGDGYFEGEGVIITWAIGHLMELKEPSDYDKKWKSWSLSSLPILPNCLGYKPNSKTKKQCTTVIKQLKRKDLDRVVLATDAGREGELIGRTLINESKCKVDFFRFWTSQALSPSVIKDSMSKLKPLVEYDRLYYAGRSRQSADWLVGMNLSRLATIRMGDLFSVGRVQTAVLALLVNKRDAIDSFDPQPFYTIDGKFKFKDGDLIGSWFDPEKKEESTRIKTREEAQKILATCKGQPAQVSNVTVEKKWKVSPQLFSLTELQKVANKRFGFSAKHTLNTAQNLYEKHKCLSYPRTDARVLGTQSLDQVKELLGQFQKESPDDFKYFDKKMVSLSNNRVFDDEKLTDHHALMPLKSARLSGDENKIFELVLKRFIMVFSLKFEYEETKLITKVDTESFKSKGQRVVCLGWKALSGGSKEQFLPTVKEGEQGEVVGFKPEKKMTKPPAEYTEATLLQDMINPSRLIEGKELKQVFRGEVGLGTQATRAQIIETLIMRKYIERKGKGLVAVSRGKTLIETLKALSLSKILTSPEETAKWELELEKISQGEGSARTFMLDIRKFIADSADEWRTADVTRVKSADSTRPSIGECPLCKSSVIETPKSYGCERWREGCKFTVWKKIAKRKISLTQAKKVLTTGKSDLLKGFKSKAGKEFSAMLVVKGDGVGFEFAEKKNSAVPVQGPPTAKKIPEEGPLGECPPPPDESYAPQSDTSV